MDAIKKYAFLVLMNWIVFEQKKIKLQDKMAAIPANFTYLRKRFDWIVAIL